jgi:hypothetical protein
MTSQHGAHALHAGLGRLHALTRKHTPTRPGAHMHAHTHACTPRPINNTYCFSTATMIRERVSVFRHIYKVVQIWPGLIVCKQVTVCPGHIWTTLYIACLALTMYVQEYFCTTLRWRRPGVYKPETLCFTDWARLMHEVEVVKKLQLWLKPSRSNDVCHSFYTHLTHAIIVCYRLNVYKSDYKKVSCY